MRIDSFWAGARAATIGAVATMLVPPIAQLLDRRARRLRSLRAVRTEIRANLTAMRFDVAAMTPTVLSSAPVFIPLIHSIKDSVSADMAWWSESTSKLVHIFYGSIDTLARLIVTHEAEINKPHPGPAKPGEMAWHANPAGTRENASEQRNNAIRFGDWQFFA